MTTPVTKEYRPWSPAEVEEATQRMTEAYQEKRLSHASILKMFNSAERHTHDAEKLQISGETPHVQAPFEWQTPMNEWTSFGNMPPLGGYSKGQEVQNAVFKDILDTTIAGGVQGGGVLARVDLIPQIFVWLLTYFPILGRVARVPSNGIEHSWNNLLDFGDASDDFIDEFGCPLPGRGTYFRGRTNIAILAVERGSSLKLEFATRQSGMLYDGNMTTYDLEMRNAVWARAKLMQAAVYRGTTQEAHGNQVFSGTGHTTNSEFGQSFVNGFNGLRVLLSESANSVVNNFYPTGFSPNIVEKETDGTIMDAIDQAAGQILQNGGQPTAIHLSVNAARKLRGEATPFVRYMMNDATSSGFVLGGHVRAVDTVAGELPLVVVPGNAIGTYNASNITGTTGFGSNTEVEDIYVLSEQQMALPYLGSPDPLPIEIPLGIPDASGLGCLVRKFIIYWMMGLAVYVPVHQAKVRIPVL